MQDTQGALVETETERNTLRRQLARMSKKYGPGKAGEPALSEAAATAAVAGAVSIDPASGAEGLGEEVGSVSDSEGSQHLSHLLHDAEAELAAIRDENSMLMEHLVTTKVRLAEVEGDYLESRRALLRSREKQMQLARQVLEVQMVGAGGTPQEPAEEEKTPSAGRTDGSERRRSLKLPGF